MESASQLYSLTWGEYGTSLSSAVQSFRGHGDLVDVTLAAGGRTFSAHKVVLCAASPYLLELMKSTPCQHPVIVLAGIAGHDLECILEFIYRGEVNVEPSQLPSLLQAAHFLSINGLTPTDLAEQNVEEEPLNHTVEDVEESTADDSKSSYTLQRKRRKKRKGVAFGKSETTESSGSKDSEDIQEEEEKKESKRKRLNSNQSEKDKIKCRDMGLLAQHNLATPLDSGEAMVTEPDIKTNIQNFIPQAQFPSLPIPQFPGAMNVGFPMSTPIPSIVSAAMSAAALKIRGASDCPGICPLCGCTLRQARNLRRHLLSSCKYRFTSNSLYQTTGDQNLRFKSGTEMPNAGILDGVLAKTEKCEEIVCNPSCEDIVCDPNEDLSSDPNCEQIVCNPALSPLSVVSSSNNIASPVAR